MFVPNKVQVGAVSVALALASIGFSTQAALERAGPVSVVPAVGKFADWYQDKTGIGLEFCAPDGAELAGGWCVVTPNAVGAPGVLAVPESLPNNFFDEHFYYVGSASIPVAAPLIKAQLTLALEAAFASGAAQDGQQITFARLRMLLNPVPADGTYRFIHPYGEVSIDALAGDRIFYTDDVGATCTGNFECALTSNNLGPFLLPSANPGGNEIGPVTAAVPVPDPANTPAPTAYPGNGKAYIADPARLGPVTGGSPVNFIDSTGRSRNHNIFRIEGPRGSNLDGAGGDAIETANFTLAGRLYTGAMPGRVTVNRASYTDSAGVRKLDVFANAFATVQSRMPAAPRPAPVTSTLSFYDKPCRGVADGAGGVLPPFSAPAAPFTLTPMKAAGELQWAQALPATIPSEVCVLDSTARNAAGGIVPVYFPSAVKDEVSVTTALFNPNLRTLTVAASSSDAAATLAVADPATPVVGQVVVGGLFAPTSMTEVQSTNKHGATRLLVSTGFATAAPTGPTAFNDAATFPMRTTPATTPQPINVLANDSNATGGAVTVTSAPALGTTSVSGGTVTFSPNQFASGVDSFQYTVTTVGGTSNPATVTLNITPVNVAPVAVNDSFNALANVPATLNVLSNDTDVNGATTIRAPVIVQAPGGGASAVVSGNAVNFTAPSAGTYTFTYRASDTGIPVGSNVLTSNVATVTVTVAAAEVNTISRAEYVRSKSRLRVEGSVAPASGQQIVVDFLDAGGNKVGSTIATVTSIVSTAAPNWTLDIDVAAPAAAVTIRATSPHAVGVSPILFK